MLRILHACWHKSDCNRARRWYAETVAAGSFISFLWNSRQGLGVMPGVLNSSSSVDVVRLRFSRKDRVCGFFALRLEVFEHWNPARIGIFWQLHHVDLSCSRWRSQYDWLKPHTRYFFHLTSRIVFCWDVLEIVVPYNIGVFVAYLRSHVLTCLQQCMRSLCASRTIKLSRFSLLSYMLLAIVEAASWC